MTAIPSLKSNPERVVRYGMVRLYPFFFRGEGGVFEGYIPDLLKLLAEGEGWELSFIEAPGDELPGMLQERELDLLSMAPTPRLEALFDFGKVHHYATWFTFFTRSDSEILSFHDLEEKRISMQSGFYSLTELRRILDGLDIRYSLIETSTVEEAIELLKTGQADVCAAEQLATANTVRRLGFRRSPIIFAPSRVFFTTTKGENADLLARLDEKLATLNANPLSALKIIQRRWYYDDEFVFFPQWAARVFSLTIIVLVLVGSGLLVFYRKEKQLRLRSSQLEERLASERFLGEAARMLLSDNGREEILRIACDMARNITNARRLLILRSVVFSERRRSVDIFFEYAEPGLPLLSELRQKRNVLLADLPKQWIVDLARKKVIKGRIGTSPSNELFPASSSEGESFSFYPLFEGGRFWGTLAISLNEHNQSSETTDLLLSTFSEMISAHLLNKRQERRLIRLATTDALTGLLNRRSFFVMLAREIARSVRRGHPFSLILCDIDLFKSVNDSYGHDAGDEVLRQFARFLRKGVRAEDIPVRQGGEEFGVLLPETDLHHAHQAAERLRCQIEQSLFEVACGPVQPVILRLTASFGVGQFGGAEDSASGLFSRVDKALYRAKSEGRNRVFAAAE